MTDKLQEAPFRILPEMEFQFEGLTFSLSEELPSTAGKLNIGVDFTPYWIEIAFDHLNQATELSKELVDAKNNKVNDIGTYWRPEMKASMQSIVACAIALDAFYANVKRHNPLPDDVRVEFNANRSARYKRIAETLRQAFSIEPEPFTDLRNFLKQLSNFRDQSVHPFAGRRLSSIHPELELLTEKRYAMFRSRNAYISLKASLTIIIRLSRRLRDNDSAFGAYCKNVHSRIEQTVSRFEERYGSLEQMD